MFSRTKLFADTQQFPRSVSLNRFYCIISLHRVSLQCITLIINSYKWYALAIGRRHVFLNEGDQLSKQEQTQECSNSLPHLSSGGSGDPSDLDTAGLSPASATSQHPFMPPHRPLPPSGPTSGLPPQPSATTPGGMSATPGLIGSSQVSMSDNSFDHKNFGEPWALNLIHFLLNRLVT